MVRDEQQDLRANQIRFVNRRGIKVSFRLKELRMLGYEAVVFRQDTDGLLAELTVNKFKYSVKLDREFNLDLEGKAPPSPIVTESLHCLLLSLLKPILCEIREKTPGGENDGNLEVIARVGHYRELTGGQHYSAQAVLNCFEETGKDLVAEQERLRKRPDRETSNRFTYVRQVKEKEENMPPLEFTVAHIPRFE